MFKNFPTNPVLFFLVLLMCACTAKQQQGDDVLPSGSFPDPDPTSAPFPMRNKRTSASLAGLVTGPRGEVIPSAYSIKGVGGELFYVLSDNSGFFHYSSDNMLEDGTILATNALAEVSAPVILQAGRTHFIKKRLLFGAGVNYPYEQIFASGMSFGGDNESNFEYQFESGTLLKGSSVYTDRMLIHSFLMGNETPYLDEMQVGDMRGIKSDGKIVVLSPLLMGGIIPEFILEKYEIAPGRKIDLKIKIPFGARSVAPNEAPLWRYDQKEGLWVEAGKAVRTGNKYLCSITQLGHLCIAEEAPAVYVHLKLVDKKNNPLPLTPVLINIKSDNAARLWPNGLYTNSTGELSTFLPYDVAWSVTVKDLCGNSYATKTMQPATQSLWKTLEIDVLTANQTLIEGNAFSCDDVPLASGAIIIKNNGFEYPFPVKDGKYSFNFPVCANAGDNIYQYKLYDSTSKQETAYEKFTPIKGVTTTMPDVEVCTLFTKPVKGDIIFTAENKTYTVRSETDSLLFVDAIDQLSGKRVMGIYGFKTDVYLTFKGTTAGSYKLYTCSMLAPGSPPYFMTWGLYPAGDIIVDELDRKKRILRGSFRTLTNKNFSVYNTSDTATVFGTFDVHL